MPLAFFLNKYSRELPPYSFGMKPLWASKKDAPLENLFFLLFERIFGSLLFCIKVEKIAHKADKKHTFKMYLWFSILDKYTKGSFFVCVPSVCSPVRPSNKVDSSSALCSDMHHERCSISGRQ